MKQSQTSVRQDQPGHFKPAVLSPEEDAARIERLKAARGSHHTAGGCAEEQATALSSYKRMVRAGLL